MCVYYIEFHWNKLHLINNKHSEATILIFTVSNAFIDLLDKHFISIKVHSLIN